MATPAQITANRANAKKSTGPRTPEGKTKCKLNAISWGFAAATRFISGEDPEDFYGLQVDLVREYQPATTTEQILVEKMVHNHWLTLRAIRLQSEAFHRDGDASQTPPDLGLLIRYQSASERNFYKARTELLKAQKERGNSEIGSVWEFPTGIPEPAPEPEAAATPEPEPETQLETQLETMTAILEQETEDLPVSGRSLAAETNSCRLALPTSSS